ncbi:unnamed protein product, partial [Prorocentrum cordatum]
SDRGSGKASTCSQEPPPHISRQMFAMKIATGLFLLVASAETSRILRSGEPKGAGIPEPTKELACGECSKYAEYLDTKDPCVCHATDVMRTFANDATKELTTAKGYGFETVNTGKQQLAFGWMWPLARRAGRAKHEGFVSRSVERSGTDERGIAGRSLALMASGRCAEGLGSSCLSRCCFSSC